MRIAPTIAIAALAPLVLACCSDNTLRPINNSSSSSPPQTLVVTNASPNALTIGSGPAATSIPPGGTLKIAFHVDTMTMTSPSSASPPGYTETFVETSTPARFDQEKNPPELVFHNGNVPVIATLSVDLCKPPGWRVNVTNSGTYSIRVPNPVPGIPQPVCPP